MSIIPQSHPLTEEEELCEDVEIHIFTQKLPVFLHSLRLVQADVLILPLYPALHTELSLDRHIKGVVLKPSGIVYAKLLKLIGKLLLAPLESDAQHLKAAVIDFAVIHALWVAAPVYPGKLGAFYKPVFYQHIQIYIIGVTGKGGEGGIWAVAIACRAERQKLPILLARAPQKINKFVRAFAHCADAVI